jgi:ABC-type molybdate transport system permease subunit
MLLETELWMLGISVAAAVVPWAFSLHAKVAVIASSVESLPRMLDELRQTIEEHEVRLNAHDKTIEALSQASTPGR